MNTFKSGQHIKRDGGFRSFEPSLINRSWLIDNPSVIDALSKADRQLGRLDMFSQYVPNLSLFVQMHVTKEATKSSRIEDTRTEINEAILPEEEVDPERRDDWREVNNYISAVSQAQNALDSLPFSLRLLRQAHETLLKGARGDDKLPGEFRTSQNWIGGSNPGNARFVPPAHENVLELMSDLERFAHNEDIHLPPLIRVAIMHYQFETIHPFLDGNGRIGRLMIPLYLISQDILKAPVLYLSDFLERHRQEYYDRLTAVREKNDIAGWLLFFLDGISETAAKGVITFDNILRFKQYWDVEIPQWKRHSTAGATLFQYLFTHPWVNASIVADVTGVSSPTGYKIIEQFCNCGLLVETTGAQRGRNYIFDPYLQLFA
jgi:Fic family protein